MAYYEDIVAEYLCAERHRFVCPNFNLDLDDGGPGAKERNWWIDILTVDFDAKTVFLCEVTYSKTLYALFKRLKLWSTHWSAMVESLVSNAKIPRDWTATPWIFTPEALKPMFDQRVRALGPTPFTPKWTSLESTVPWLRPQPSAIAAAKRAAGGSDAEPVSARSG